MTIADSVFHNIYLLQELFSCAEPQRRYCDLASGDDIAAKGLTKLLQLKAANEKDLPFTTRAMDLAACHGHLTTVIYLHENRTEGCTINAMKWAAENGHLPVVKWLYDNRRNGYLSSAIIGASKSNQFEVAMWLYANTPVKFNLQCLSRGGFVGIDQFVESFEKLLLLCL